jgi:hypothetical protein
MFEGKCPMCGTSGRVWNRDPEVFMCPNCSSLYSQFGMVLEPESKEMPEMWS